MAGSIQLNKRFEEQVKMLVGEDQYYHLRKTSAYDQALRFFDETVKIAFRGKKNESWYVNFPMAHLEDDESQGLKRSTWEMKRYVGEMTLVHHQHPTLTQVARWWKASSNL